MSLVNTALQPRPAGQDCRSAPDAESLRIPRDKPPPPTATELQAISRRGGTRTACTLSSILPEKKKKQERVGSDSISKCDRTRITNKESEDLSDEATRRYKTSSIISLSVLGIHGLNGAPAREMGSLELSFATSGRPVYEAAPVAVRGVTEAHSKGYSCSVNVVWQRWDLHL